MGTFADLTDILASGTKTTALMRCDPDEHFSATTYAVSAAGSSGMITA
jgi:hypothetical protein